MNISGKKIWSDGKCCYSKRLKNVFPLERRHHKFFHALRDLQISRTEFIKEFFYLSVCFGNFWNLLQKKGEFEFGFGNEVELNSIRCIC